MSVVAKTLAAIVAIPIVLLGIWLLWSSYRPELLLDPINRQVHVGFLECRDQHKCPDEHWHSLVPSVFAVGQDRAHVERLLKAAGFDEPQDDGEGSSYFGRYGAALAPFFCTQIYNVKVIYDAANQLREAATSFTGTPSCL